MALFMSRSAPAIGGGPAAIIGLLASGPPRTPVMSASTRRRLLLVPLLALAACSTSDSPAGDGTTSKEERPPVLVGVAEVVQGEVDRRLEATANVASLDVVAVMPERAEPVARVLAEEGDVVAAGQVLAELRADIAALQVAEAEVLFEETRVAMEKAERDHQRNLRLKETSSSGGTVLVSDSDLENSLQAWNAARTAHLAAQVAKDRAALELAQCTLRAPIAGTVTARDISLGDMTAVGARAFEITDLSAPKVVFYRPQRELGDLRVGQPLTARSEALPGRAIGGHIERVAPTVDQETGTVKVVAALEPGELVLPTGILVEIELVLDVHDDAVLVPKRALLYESGNVVVVFLVQDVEDGADGRRTGVAKRLEVIPGYDDEERLEVLEGSGLQPGDLVVDVGADRLADGDRVELAREE